MAEIFVAYSDAFASQRAAEEHWVVAALRQRGIMPQYFKHGQNQGFDIVAARIKNTDATVLDFERPSEDLATYARIAHNLGRQVLAFFPEGQGDVETMLGPDYIFSERSSGDVRDYGYESSEWVRHKDAVHKASVAIFRGKQKRRVIKLNGWLTGVLWQVEQDVLEDEKRQDALLEEFGERHPGLFADE